jgi:hypothetical protein
MPVNVDATIAAVHCVQRGHERGGGFAQGMLFSDVSET